LTTRCDWIPADWAAPAGVIAGCTVRSGGVSAGRYRSLNLGAHVGDDPAAVAENRRRFAANVPLPKEPAWLDQVHGNTVVVEPRAGAAADASLTRSPGIVCAVLVADCLPVLFCTDDGVAVAAAHAGWRGLAAGVLENTVRAFGVAPARLLAWLGPAISQPAYEVGGEVRDAFVAHDRRARGCFLQNGRGRWQADLAGLARQRLDAIGVSRVSGGNSCTYAEPGRFFSYRRDGQCGRVAAFIFRRTASA